MPRKWFLIILSIVIIPVSMISWKIMEYARENKLQVAELHRHIVHALSLNTTAYFMQLNTRLAFAPDRVVLNPGPWQIEGARIH